MSPRAARPEGVLALVGGGEWGDGLLELHREMASAAGAREVLVLPTAAAFERPGRVVQQATDQFAASGTPVRELAVLNRREAEEPAHADAVRSARFVYLADGSPMHLRSVLWGSPLFEALVEAYRKGAAVAASGAGATVLGDPMVDPRGGAYTVGLGLVKDLAVFPYHGTSARHLLERSVDLLAPTATLVGIDEETALVRDPGGSWRVAGAGKVTIYEEGEPAHALGAGSPVPGLPA